MGWCAHHCGTSDWSWGGGGVVIGQGGGHDPATATRCGQWLCKKGEQEKRWILSGIGPLERDTGGGRESKYIITWSACILSCTLYIGGGVGMRGGEGVEGTRRWREERDKRSNEMSFSGNCTALRRPGEKEWEGEGSMRESKAGGEGRRGEEE